MSERELSTQRLHNNLIKQIAEMKEQEKHFSSYLTNGSVWHRKTTELLKFMEKNKN